MKRALPFASSILLACALLAPAALAQNANLEVGLKPYGSFHGGDLDTVSLTSGNLMLHIPLSSYPQRGQIQANYFLVLNSKNWQVQFFNNTQGGFYKWMLSTRMTNFGVSIASDQGPTLTRVETVTSDPTSGTTVVDDSYTVITPDGSSHPLPYMGAGVLTGFTTDATGFKVVLSGSDSFGAPSTATITDRSGVRYIQSVFTTTSHTRSTDGQSNIDVYYQSAVPATIEDRNGNKATYQAVVPFDPTKITDSLGRALAPSTSTTNYTNCRVPASTTSATLVNFVGPNGGTSQVKLCYETFALSTSFSQSGVQQGSATKSMLTTVVLPNSTRWIFTYDAYGNLSSLTLPTGGTITYAWGELNRSNISGCNDDYLTQVSRGVIRRTVNANDGSGNHIWTYTWGAAAPDGSYTNTITDPAGNDSVHVLSPVGSTCALYETRTQYYQGAASGNQLLKQVDTHYAHGSVDPTTNIVPDTITTTWPGGKVSQVQKAYDTGVLEPGANFNVIYGDVVQESDYDFGQGTPGSLLRTTFKTYVWQNDVNYQNLNMVSLVSSVRVCSPKVGLESGDCDAGHTVQRRAETDYAYDQSSLVASGVTTQHDANPVTGTHRGNLTTTSRWLSPATWLSSTATYYDTGMVQQMKDPLLHATTFTYSGTFAGAYPTQACNALGQCASTNYDFNTGLVLSTTDPNGNTSSTAYDTMFRATQQNLPDGGLTTFSYNDALPNPSVTVTTKINATQNTTSTAVVDGLGRVVQTQVNPADTVYVDTAYDGNGRKASVSNPHRSGVSSTDGITSYQYDGLGRVVKEIPPDGTSSANNVTTVYADNCVTVTDQAGKQRRSCSDALGRLTQVFEAPNSSNYETDYFYDALGNLLCAEQHGGVTGTGCAADPSFDASSPWRVRRSTYDSLSRLLTAKNPESGTVSWSYDADSKVITKTDARGITITYSYDALDRVTGKSYSNGDAAVSYLYDQTSYNGLAITNGIGRQTGMADASGATAWSFDVMGRALSERRTIQGVTKSVGYTYNLDGSVATVVYPSGRTITYSYNNAGQAVGAQDQANGINYATAASYAPPGELAGVTYGASGSFAGIVTANSFNSRLQPASIQASSSAGTVLDLTYSFNSGTPQAPVDNGTLVKITNNRDPNRSQNFTYDALNRVASAWTDGPNWGDTYTVDAWGNLTNKTQMGNKTGGEGALNLGANVTNRFLGMSYDASGNLLADATSTYTYDAENRIKTAAGVTYTYDGNGERVAKSTGVLYWGGSSKDALDESDAAGNLTNEYVFFNGKRVARRVVATGAVYYYFADHLGSSNVITDAGGVRQAESDFYPYGGEVVILADATANHYKFTGKERDETGVDYFFARYYSSALGRFLTPDWSATPVPVPYASLGDPQSLNLYSYVENNPITGTDPTGHLIAAFNQSYSSPDATVVSNEADGLITDAYHQQLVDEIEAQTGSHGQFFNLEGNPGREAWAKQVRSNVASAAANLWNSTEYLEGKSKDNYPAGKNKCNQLVADVIGQSGAYRPRVPRSGILGWLGFDRDPLAHEWADPKVHIPGWSSPMPVSAAGPGDVIAQAHGSYGHVGIVVAPGSTISVNSTTSPKGIVTLNNWGFRHAPENGELPGDPPVIVRRYTGSD